MKHIKRIVFIRIAQSAIGCNLSVPIETESAESMILHSNNIGTRLSNDYH